MVIIKLLSWDNYFLGSTAKKKNENMQENVHSVKYVYMFSFPAQNFVGGSLKFRDSRDDVKTPFCHRKIRFARHKSKTRLV